MDQTQTNTVDTFLGHIIYAVEAKRANRPVIVIVLGDHGEALGEHNDIMHASSLLDEQTRISLVINARDIHADTTNILTSQIDVAPTILSLAKLPEFNGFQGLSLVDSKLTEPFKRPIFLTLQVIRSAHALVEWPYKGIWYGDLSNIAVYNLETDPNEKIDLSLSDPALAERFKAQINEFRSDRRAYHLLPTTVKRQSIPPKYDKRGF
jgi:arylsulfatase A-like enzyme